jgi:hypothetical protein
LFKHGLVVLLALALVVSTFANPRTIQAQSLDSDVSAKVRSDVQRLSLNRDDKVEVRLKDKTKRKGYIRSVDQGTFSLSESKTGGSQTIEYADVVDVKRSGNGFSKKPWLIAAGIAAGVIITWIVVKPAVCDGGAQSRGIC